MTQKTCTFCNSTLVTGVLNSWVCADCGATDKAQVSREEKARFDAVKNKLKQKGTLATAIEFDPDGCWIGLLLEKNLEYHDERDQKRFAHTAYPGSTKSETD